MYIYNIYIYIYNIYMYIIYTQRDTQSAFPLYGYVCLTFVGIEDSVCHEL